MKRVRREDTSRSKSIKTYKKLGKSIPKDKLSKSKERKGVKLNTDKTVII